MKIIRLESENVKRLKAVEINPEGAIVRITGKNANGKTSVLDSILYALGGERAIPDQPIRKGAKRARIEVDLGEYTVERLFTAKGAYLKVTAKDGAAVKSPQRMLDSDSMKVIETLATDNDYQVWVEQVDESGEVGFYIEDGSLVAVNGDIIGDEQEQQNSL